MRRIRLTLLAVALAVGVPVALLAWRALEGLALERAVRHQAVAERAFDEMERALSDWLATEEARPFEDYRFYLSADRRSPLSLPPTDPFVVGAFQIDPDGSVHTPLRPRDPDAAATRGHWPPGDGVEGQIAQVTRIVREGLAAKGDGTVSSSGEGVDREPERKVVGGKKEKDASGRRDRQDPGTTRPLSGPLAAREWRAEQDLDDAKEGADSAYELLKRLNTGADARASRKQQIAEAKIRRPAPAPRLSVSTAEAPQAAAEPAPPTRSPSAGFYDSARPGPEAPVEEREPFAQGELELNQLRGLGYVVSDTEPLTPAESIDKVLEQGEVRVALDPMVGRDVGGGHLLVYRTVLVGELGYRQGLVLDRGALGRWLSERALAPSGLSRVATLRFDEPEPSAGGRFSFAHRFAEPFDALTARLSLASLPGIGSPGAIYALVGLLALVGVAGLLAIHRMVGVTVHFAERRSNFVAAVTHELKTPLTAIRMYGEMLRDGLVDHEAKKEEYYGTITDESERLSRLIDNVLEFSKLERGAREMSFCVGPIDPVLREAAEKLRTHASREGFRLELSVEPGLPPVRYDRDALLQVIFNLVDNAMKYAGSAASRVVVLEAKAKDPGVELSVRDFGPGVPGRHLSRIFEPFYRGEDELTRSAKGTGIGLALVRELVERMGAAVRGANAEGGGFRVAVDFSPAGESGA
jgi:signal transduction histidine kinase